MEIKLNETRLRVYECGKIEKFGKISWNSKETWFELKGTIFIHPKSGYKSHKTKINKKEYITSRIIYFAFNQDWDIHNSSKNNSIDHIDRISLNNHISNLRVANASEQALNRDYVINAKGCYWHKNKQKWIAQIRIKKLIHIGSFDTENEAHQAYLDAKLKYLSV